LSKHAKDLQNFQKKNKDKYSNYSESNQIAGCQNAIVITVQTTLTTLIKFAIGVVSFALQKGYSETSEIPENPFYAEVYLVTILENAMKAINPGVTTVPIWLHGILHLFAPKREPSEYGYATFNWDIQFQADDTEFQTDMGPPGCDRFWNAGVVQTGPLINNLFPLIGIPAAYNAILGQTAWTSVLNYLKTIDEVGSELIEVGAFSTFDHDVSAFADVIRVLGANGTDNGGYFKNVSCEVPIKNPMLSVFVAPNPTLTGDPSRNRPFVRAASSDSTFVAGVLSSTLSNRLVRTKVPPVLCPIDFNRFVDVLGLWVSMVQTLYSKDYQDQIEFANDPLQIQLPLTLQELQLLLRNEFMQAFSATQFAVQASYPLSIGENKNPFVPFVCGVGTYGVATTPMILPRYFAENIRCLTARLRTGKNTLAFLPVIGVYCEDNLNWKDYVYSGIDTQPFQSFVNPNTAFQYPDKSTKLGFRVSAEQPISILDGRAAGAFYAINHPTALEMLVMKWNDWIVKIKPFTGNLTAIASDGGITVATIIRNMDIITEAQIDLQGRELRINTTMVCERFKSPVQDGSTIYDKRFRLAVISATPFLNHIWNIIQSTWIPPESRLVPNGSLVSSTTTIKKIQSYTNEVYSLVFADGAENVPISSIHHKYASSMTRTRNGEMLVVEEVMSTLEKQGRSGFLSSLAGGLLSSVFPAGKDMINSVANILPF